jgi:hypothetical protein
MKVKDVIRLLEEEGCWRKRAGFWLQRAAVIGNTSTWFGPDA